VNVILTRSHSAGSFAIRARLWENWSHAIAPVSPVHCIDSTFQHGGVRRRTMVEALGAASARLYLHIPLENEEAATAFLYSQLGKDYDSRAIFGWAGAGRDWHDEYAWFCFELVAAAIEAGSSYRFANRNRVTGKDLINASKFLKGEA
jgi:hypothetical protein